MRSYLCHLVLLMMINLVLLETQHLEAAASSPTSSESDTEKNMTHGCLGFSHDCVVSDQIDVVDMFMDPDSSGMLFINPKKGLGTSGFDNRHKPAVSCPKSKSGQYTFCLGVNKHSITKPFCNPRNRDDQCHY